MTAMERIDPLAGFRFGVEIEGVIVGWFTECSNLSLEREITPQPEGGVNYFVHQLPGRLKAANVTLKRGLAGNELWDWLQQGQYNGQVKPRHVSIILFKADQTEAQRWELTNTYPVKWSSSNFNSGSREIPIESLELVQDAGNGSSVGSPGSVAQRNLDSQEVEPAAPADQVDLPTLAKKVYALLRQELRIERDRLGRGE